MCHGAFQMACCKEVDTQNKLHLQHFLLKLTNAISDGSPRPGITGYSSHFLLTCAIKPVSIDTTVGDNVPVGIGWLEISFHTNSWLKVRCCTPFMNKSERQGNELHMVKKEEREEEVQLTGPEPASSSPI